jgi:hypothetical protein
LPDRFRTSFDFDWYRNILSDLTGILLPDWRIS